MVSFTEWANRIHQPKGMSLQSSNSFFNALHIHLPCYTSWHAFRIDFSTNYRPLNSKIWVIYWLIGYSVVPGNRKRGGFERGMYEIWNVWVLCEIEVLFIPLSALSPPRNCFSSSVSIICFASGRNSLIADLMSTFEPSIDGIKWNGRHTAAIFRRWRRYFCSRVSETIRSTEIDRKRR